MLINGKSLLDLFNTSIPLKYSPDAVYLRASIISHEGGPGLHTISLDLTISLDQSSYGSYQAKLTGIDKTIVMNSLKNYDLVLIHVWII